MNSGDIYARQVLNTVDVNAANSISGIRDPFRRMFGAGFAQELDAGIRGRGMLSFSTGLRMSMTQIGKRCIGV